MSVWNVTNRDGETCKRKRGSTRVIVGIYKRETMSAAKRTSLAALCLPAADTRTRPAIQKNWKGGMLPYGLNDTGAATIAGLFVANARQSARFNGAAGDAYASRFIIA